MKDKAYKITEKDLDRAFANAMHFAKGVMGACPNDLLLIAEILGFYEQSLTSGIEIVKYEGLKDDTLLQPTSIREH